MSSLPVIASFRGTVPYGLSLEIGDTVQILEKCDGERPHSYGLKLCEEILLYKSAWPFTAWLSISEHFPGVRANYFFLTKLVHYIFNVRSWESNEVLFLSWLYFFLIYCPFSALPWEVESTGTRSVCRSSWLTLSLEGFPVTPGLKKSEGHTPKMELLRLSLKREHLKLSSKKPRRIARLHASFVVSLLQI